MGKELIHLSWFNGLRLIDVLLSNSPTVETVGYKVKLKTIEIIKMGTQLNQY
jgi:hypothetical protein